MVLKLDAQASDTLESAATASVAVANLLNVNVNFYYNRVSYWVSPGETAAEVIASVSKTTKKKE
jgi:hypothetical protein